MWGCAGQMGVPTLGTNQCGARELRGLWGPSSKPRRRRSLPTARVGKLRHGGAARARCRPAGALWGAGVTRGAPIAPWQRRGARVGQRGGAGPAGSCTWRERWRDNKPRGGTWPCAPRAWPGRGERCGVPVGGGTAPATGWRRALRCGVHGGGSPSSGGCGWGLRARGCPYGGVGRTGGATEAALSRCHRAICRQRHGPHGSPPWPPAAPSAPSLQPLGHWGRRVPWMGWIGSSRGAAPPWGGIMGTSPWP